MDIGSLFKSGYYKYNIRGKNCKFAEVYLVVSEFYIIFACINL